MSENQLIIKFSTVPGTVDENIAAVSAQVDQWLKSFEGLEDADDEQIGEVKKKLTELRNGRKVIDDERKRIKKAYLVPLEEFEGKVRPITDKIDKAIALGKSRVDEVEQARMEKKREEVTALWNALRPADMPIDISLVWDDRYLNKTGIGASYGADLQAKANRIKADSEAIQGIMAKDPEQGSFLAEEYLKTADLSAAMRDWSAHVERQHQLEEMKRKAEEEAAARKAQMAEIAQKRAQEAQDASHEEIHAESKIEPQAQENPGNSEFYTLTFHMERVPKEAVRGLNHFLHDNGIRFTVLEKIITDEAGNRLN